MLHFTRHAPKGVDSISVEIENIVIAGWTGRDETALRHHIEELAHLGVAPPSDIPLFYRVGARLLNQGSSIQVVGGNTSGEVEPVVVSMADGLWLGVGSDHTDRKAEAISVALSKQLCQKPIGTHLWRVEDVKPHWDQLLLASYALIDGERHAYQAGSLAAIRPPQDLFDRGFGTGQVPPPGTAMFLGTLPAIGGVRPAERFEIELIDPVLNRSIQHGYDIEVLPRVE
jgi:hypothetical protein